MYEETVFLLHGVLSQFSAFPGPLSAQGRLHLPFHLREALSLMYQKPDPQSRSPLPSAQYLLALSNVIYRLLGSGLSLPEFPECAVRFTLGLLLEGTNAEGKRRRREAVPIYTEQAR